jgi:hypothetical protein
MELGVILLGNVYENEQAQESGVLQDQGTGGC